MRNDHREIDGDVAIATKPSQSRIFRAPESPASWLPVEPPSPPMPSTAIPLATAVPSTGVLSAPPTLLMSIPSPYPSVAVDAPTGSMPKATPSPAKFQAPCPDDPDIGFGPTPTPAPPPPKRE
jgi:hypothetical protein